MAMYSASSALAELSRWRRSLLDVGNEALLVRGVAVEAGKEHADAADERQRLSADRFL